MLVAKTNPKFKIIVSASRLAYSALAGATLMAISNANCLDELVTYTGNNAANPGAWDVPPIGPPSRACRNRPTMR